ncbi:MAG: cation:proton antiporter, partial [Candidatus Rifleibacteriota bacterium]
MAFGIALVILCGLVADWLFRYFNIPGLVGMLVVGIIFGPFVLKVLDHDLLLVSSDLRLIAMIVILLRVGFSLSRKTLHSVAGRVFLLAFVPAILEGVAITFISKHLLELTLLESALLGTVVAAVSPAVVVPAMLRLIHERKGEKHEVPAMVMAAASVDDIFVIVCHSIVLGLYITSDRNILAKIGQIPVSLGSGAVIGLLLGYFLYRLFEHYNPRATKRVLIIIAVSIMLVHVQNHFAGRIPFSGLVAAMAIGFIILEKREIIAHELASKLAKIWVFAELVLFTMVGAQVNIQVAFDAGISGFLIIFVGLLARSLGVFICLFRSRLRLKERLFVIASFTPKATVQAAIGASPLLAMKMAGMQTQPGELILG